MNEVTHIARFQAAFQEFNPEVGRGCRVFLIFTNARGKMVVETSRRITGADKSVGRLRTTRDEDLDYMCLVGHIDPMKTIEIPIRELHARTGHFVRKAAADMRVIITDRGKPVAQLQSLGTADSGQPKRPKWKDRVLVPGYVEIMNTPVSGDSTAYISEDRDRGSDW